MSDIRRVRTKGTCTIVYQSMQVSFCFIENFYTLYKNFTCTAFPDWV